MHRALTTSLYRGLITLSMGMLLPGLGAAAVSATEGDDVPDGQETQPTPSLSALQTRDSTVPLGLMYYVTTNGSDSADGQSWETAKLTIQAALSDAASGSTVLVSNGIYSIASQIAVTNGVTVRSVNGADYTVVEQAAGYPVVSPYDSEDRLVLLKHAEAVFDGFSITKATGGPVYIDTAGTLQNCIVSNNYSINNSINGGGVYLKNGGLVKNCQIINNTAKSSGGAVKRGGGIYMDGGGLIDTCIITNNTSDSGSGATGGGVFMTGTACTLRNSLIADNFAQANGAGVYNTSGTIESCTIVDNETPSVTGVGGLYNDKGKVINTIIAYNNNANGLSNHQNAGTTWAYSYTCTDPAVPGDGNTDRAPQFVDFDAKDYRLLAGPCVDTGTNQLWMADALDLDGNPRIISGTVDMGALELVPGPLRIGFEGIPTEGFASNLVVFTAYASGTNTTGLYYAWSLDNDETIDIEGFGRSVVTNLYWPGLYSVSLTVSNAINETDMLVREQYIKVAPETAYVSTNGASIYPYDSWANAATNIQDALDAGMDGTLVLVNDGVYGITSRIEMPLNITLRSINGAEKTEIRRTGGTIGIFYLTVPEAVVDGFTIANAADTAVYLNNGGVVSHCIIRDNHVPGSGGDGGGVRIDNAGKLAHCQIINNSRHSSGGGGARGCGIYMTGAAVVESCIITNNSTGAGVGSGGAGGGVYMTGGMLRNSLIAGNKHNITVGGIYASGGTIESCTIVSNATPAATGVGGLYNSGRTIRNSIILFNTSTNMISNYENAGAATYYNCNTYPTNGLTGSANIEDNPLFKDVARGDYRLKNDSPCINAGTNQLWMAGTVDLAGQPRILNKLVDIGAYEGRLPGGTLLILQ